MTPPLHARPSAGAGSSASNEPTRTSDTDTLSRLSHEALVAHVKARLTVG